MNFEFLNALLVLFSGVLLESWNIFVETAPYLIFGLGIAGLLTILVPDQKIVAYLEHRQEKFALLSMPLLQVFPYLSAPAEWFLPRCRSEKGELTGGQPFPSLSLLPRQE